MWEVYDDEDASEAFRRTLDAILVVWLQLLKDSVEEVNFEVELGRALRDLGITPEK